MCSLEEEDQFRSEDALDLNEKNCRHCGEVSAAVVLRKKDVYCKNCFLIMCTHKFRATLGKSKKMKPIDMVLVGYSGSFSSLALLHLLQSGIQETNHKRLVFQIIACHIDEGKISVEFKGQDQVQERIKLQLETLGLQSYYTSLESELDEAELTQMFHNVTSATAKEDLLLQLRQRVLVKVAKQLKCNKIFTAESANSLAVKLLANVSQGRGCSLPSDVGFSDVRNDGLEILRPLREFTNKELAYYCHFHQLQAVIVPSFKTMTDTNSSIQKLTEKFITGLQEEFPSTVYTVYKTADKLGSCTSLGDETCVLCHDSLQTVKPETTSAVEASNFSKSISRRGLDENATVNSLGNTCCGGTCACKGIEATKLTTQDIANYLCYGCYLIIKDMNSVDYLPNAVLKEVEERIHLNKMKDQIQDFLL